VFARNTLAVWDPLADDTIPDGMVVLSVAYPKIFVTSMLKSDMERSTKPGSFIFKRLIQSFFANDKKIWAERVGSDMLTDFPSEVGASFGQLFMFNCIHQIFRKILTYIYFYLKDFASRKDTKYSYSAMKQNLCALCVDNTAAYNNQLNQSNASMKKVNDQEEHHVSSDSDDDPSSDSDVEDGKQKKNKALELSLSDVE
jgi:hypothetical protein